MLRRIATACIPSIIFAAGLAACSSSDQAISIGPTFPTLSIYVTNSTQNAIAIYPPNPTSGSTAVNQIGGNNTQLNGPQYDAFDANKRLYVSNFNSGSGVGSVNVYASQATGNVLPIAQIGGSNTGISYARGVRVDSKGLVYLANVGPAPTFVSSILVFAAGSSGNVPPISTISGPLTGLNFPTGIALDGNGNIVVANSGNGTITSYVLATATGNVAPSNTIGGPLTGLVSPTGLTLDAQRNIYVADSSTNSISVFAANASGNVAPIRTISGSNTTLNTPSDVLLDSSGNLYVTNTGNGKVLVFPASASGNVAPSQIITVAGNVVGIALSP